LKDGNYYEAGHRDLEKDILDWILRKDEERLCMFAFCKRKGVFKIKTNDGRFLGYACKEHSKMIK
jgi:hypothetical protein